jgi:hypothetical protein
VEGVSPVKQKFLVWQMNIRFFQQWGKASFGDFRSFGLLTIWKGNIFGGQHTAGISICNFAVEFYWGVTDKSDALRQQH